MTIRTFVAAAVLLATVGLANAQADEDDWAGLYIGLDAQDGSIDHLSIVPMGDGAFDIRMVSDGISLCDPEHASGVIVATGRLVDGQLVRENVRLRCEGAEEVPIADGSYTRDKKTDIVMLAAPDNGRQMQYHRMSED